MGEKRRVIRFKILLKGDIQLEEKGEFSSRTQMIDFSRDGLRLLIPQTDFLKMGLITLKIYLPSRPLPISLQGRIKWIRHTGDYREVGIKIEKISPDDKSEILDYAYKIWREKKTK